MIVILIVYIIRVRIYQRNCWGIGHITKEFPFHFDKNIKEKKKKQTGTVWFSKQAGFELLFQHPNSLVGSDTMKSNREKDLKESTERKPFSRDKLHQWITFLLSSFLHSMHSSFFSRSQKKNLTLTSNWILSTLMLFERAFNMEWRLHNVHKE